MTDIPDLKSDIPFSLRAEIIDLLVEAEEFLDNQADADDGQPNTAMRLAIQCDDILNRLGVPCIWPRDRYAKRADDSLVTGR
jgi:hypothetical protein